MSRLEIAISHKTLWATGDVRLWTDIRLLLKDNAGNLVAQIFEVDTHTDVTTFPAYRAKELDLPFPRRAARGIKHQQTGLEIRSGYLRFLIVGMDQTEYVAPCLFLGDPDTPPNPAQQATLPSKLLQPLALLDQLRFSMKHDPGDGTLYGVFVVEKK